MQKTDSSQISSDHRPEIPQCHKPQQGDIYSHGRLSVLLPPADFLIWSQEYRDPVVNQQGNSIPLSLFLASAKLRHTVAIRHHPRLTASSQCYCNAEMVGRNQTPRSR